MVVCQYFLKGCCRFGDRCRDEHPTAKKKTVCQHFLKGYCRFGDKCWNEHPRGGGGSAGFGQQQRSAFASSGQLNRSTHRNNQNRFEALSTGSRDTFGGVRSNASDNDQTSQIKKTIENDMEIWGNSKQWPLSCYTYTKEEPCLEGFLDFSAEEIRLEAYKANAEGKADIYQQGLKDLISANQHRRLQLSQMSATQIQQEIKKQTKLPSSEAMEAGTSIFQQTNTGGGIFGNGGQSGGGLGGSFGVGSSLPQSSGFSTVTGSSSQSGLFGTGSTNNQSGVLGQSSVTGFPVSVFGNNANSNNQTTGMTGITSTFSATNQSGGLFSASTGQATASSGLFGVKTELKPGLFSSSSPTISSGIFSSGAQVQKDSGIISTSQASKNTMMGSTSLQSGTPSTATTTATTKTTAAPVSLTCSDEDMQAFRADSFVLGKIPECPPPLELC